MIESRGNARLALDSPVPSLRDDYVLVKTVAVAINPTDWQHIDGEGQPGAIVGCDYAGTVMKVGPNVTKLFAQGDRVYGFKSGAANLQLAFPSGRVMWRPAKTRSVLRLYKKRPRKDDFARRTKG